MTSHSGDADIVKRMQMMEELLAKQQRLLEILTSIQL